MHIFYNPGSGRTRPPVPTHCTNNLLRNTYSADVNKSETQWAVMATTTMVVKKKKKIITILQSIQSYTRDSPQLQHPARHNRSDDPWRLDFSRVYTLIDMSVNNLPYLWCIWVHKAHFAVYGEESYGNAFNDRPDRDSTDEIFGR